VRDERVLLYLKSYIGDAVMTEPLAHLLTASYRQISVVTSNLVRPVLWSPEYEIEFLSPIQGRSPWAVVRAALQLRRASFSTAVLVNRSFRTALIVRLAGIRRRVGHQSEGRDSLLTDRVPYPPDRFEAFCGLDLAGPLGLPVVERFPVLPVTDAERAEGRGLIGEGTVGLQPGARFPAKQLPLATTTAIARELQARGRKLVFVGGGEEAEDSLRVAAELDRPVVDLVGKTSIRSLLGAVSDLDAMIGNDTGVMHLAAGVGCPVVQVFGPTPASKWGHAYGRNRVLQAPEGKMDLVRPEDVLAATFEVLEGA
jgi:heptosyltransferase-2